MSENLDIVMTPYEALPCSLRVFTINGQDANVDDFGYGEDFRKEYSQMELEEIQEEVGEDLMDYGCIDFRWVRDEDCREEACREYGIDDDDFDYICGELEKVLYVGQCGWCI